MSRISQAVVGVLLALAPGAVACPAPERGLGVARVVEIDTTGGPIYGAVTKFAKEDRFLGPKEVVLTFDDGPSPAITSAVLATLDQFCTKATFFQVGRMAIAYPDTVKDVIARGHTIGTHTWSHPLGLVRMRPEGAKDEIERGFAAVTLAAGRPIAPFFRFPGLSDSQSLLTYLQARSIGTFTVDVISNDSYIASTDRLIKTTLDRIEQRQGGIVLFHDIKPQTARALPVVLEQLKIRGYRVVHLKASSGFEPDLAYAAGLKSLLAKVPQRGEVFSGLADAQRAIEAAGAMVVSATAPVPAASVGLTAGATEAPTTVAAEAAPLVATKRQATKRNRVKKASVGSSTSAEAEAGWSTVVRRTRTGG